MKCCLSSHVGMLIVYIRSVLLSSSGRSIFASFYYYKACPCLELWYFVLGIFFFFLRYCLVRSLHYASGNFDTNTVKESTQVWSAAQQSQGHFSFSLLMLSASHLRFPNNYGELRRQFKSLFRLGV